VCLVLHFAVNGPVGAIVPSVLAETEGQEGEFTYQVLYKLFKNAAEETVLCYILNSQMDLWIRSLPGCCDLDMRCLPKSHF
jgi:hypothetical protein